MSDGTEFYESKALSYESKALQDHSEHVGKILLVHNFSGYIGNNSHDFHFDHTVRIRVLPTAKHCGLLHWNDDWLDPYWDIEILDHLADLRYAGSFWMHGPSYNVKTGEIQRGDWKVAETELPELPPSKGAPMKTLKVKRILVISIDAARDIVARTYVDELLRNHEILMDIVLNNKVEPVWGHLQDPHGIVQALCDDEKLCRSLADNHEANVVAVEIGDPAKAEQENDLISIVWERPGCHVG